MKLQRTRPRIPLSCYGLLVRVPIGLTRRYPAIPYDEALRILESESSNECLVTAGPVVSYNSVSEFLFTVLLKNC